MTQARPERDSAALVRFFRELGYDPSTVKSVHVEDNHITINAKHFFRPSSVAVNLA